MRRLGARLGTAATAVYRHITTEDELVRRLSRSRDPEKVLADTMAAATEVAMDFPRLRERLAGSAAAECSAAPDRAVEFGLGTILDGLQAQLTATTA